MDLKSIREQALAKSKEIRDLANDENEFVSNQTLGKYCDDAVADFFEVIKIICEVANATPGFPRWNRHMQLQEESSYGCPLVGEGKFKWATMDYDNVCSHYENRPQDCDDILEPCEKAMINRENYYQTHKFKREGWLNLKRMADQTRNRALYFLKCMNDTLDRLSREQQKAVGDYAIASKVTYSPVSK